MAFQEVLDDQEDFNTSLFKKAIKGVWIAAGFNALTAMMPSLMVFCSGNPTLFNAAIFLLVVLWFTSFILSIRNFILLKKSKNAPKVKRIVYVVLNSLVVVFNIAVVVALLGFLMAPFKVAGG